MQTSQVSCKHKAECTRIFSQIKNKQKNIQNGTWQIKSISSAYIFHDQLLLDWLWKWNQFDLSRSGASLVELNDSKSIHLVKSLKPILWFRRMTELSLQPAKRWRFNTCRQFSLGCASTIPTPLQPCFLYPNNWQTPNLPRPKESQWIPWSRSGSDCLNGGAGFLDKLIGGDLLLIQPTIL